MQTVEAVSLQGPQISVYLVLESSLPKLIYVGPVHLPFLGNNKIYMSVYALCMKLFTKIL